MRILSAFLCGLIFGLGLVTSGMTDTAKVLGFLDVLAIPKGAWDPTLVIVMVAALAVSTPGLLLAKNRARPLFADAAAWPMRTAIDPPLLAGAALFGAGWGLVGLCPGPAIANLATLAPAVLVFSAAMIAGMAVHDVWRRGATKREAALADG
jgi:uncharacterized membrane protein YedE/YeeE